MRKNVIKLRMLLCIGVISLLLASCGGKEDIPETVKDLQHKIDKALETTPTYGDLKQIQLMYDELLNNEQEMVVDYDKIEEMLVPEEEDIAAICAINQFKNTLKNPNSLELYSVEVYKDTDEYYTHIEYSAQNGFGASIENDFYAIVDLPIYDTQSDTWSCEIDTYFLAGYTLDLLRGTNNTQQSTKKTFDKKSDGKIVLDVEKIMDNINILNE